MVRLLIVAFKKATFLLYEWCSLRAMWQPKTTQFQIRRKKLVGEVLLLYDRVGDSEPGIGYSHSGYYLP